ncbi:MAG: hypothetical protein ACRETG_00015 [Steroidobacteraceae bacterium]
MRLADRVAQCREPFLIQDGTTGRITRLSNSADFADEVSRCPFRFVLSDELARLCTALAYSKGARTLACADLLHVPAELVWVEWCHLPWQRELEQYGFPIHDPRSDRGGRRGALIRSTPDGRRGTVRTFWTDENETGVLASGVEAYFDLDISHDEEPEPPDEEASSTLRVSDHAQAGEDVLHRCFRFRFERSWREYYDCASLSIARREALMRHALGTIAIDIPVILAFFLLLATRSSLPRRAETLTRLNRARLKAGQAPLLEHIEVNCPLLPAFRTGDLEYSSGPRRRPRLHRVRGHLFRRGSQLFWRIPHLRGSARSGTVFTRTVTWTFDQNGQRSI